MSGTRTLPGEKVLAELASLDQEQQREQFLRQHPELHCKEVVLGIADEVTRVMRVDAVRADHLANVAGWLAELLDDDFCRARADRKSTRLNSSHRL